MVCKVQSCHNYNNDSNKGNDCILELLDFIKLHYYHFQAEHREKISYISQLETGNLALNKTIDNLRQQIQQIQNDLTPLKRKKVSSSEQADSTALSTSKIGSNEDFDNDANDPVEDLNVALTSDVIFDESCNSFSSLPQSTNIIRSPKKEKITPSKRMPLSPKNNIGTTTPTKHHLKEKQKGVQVKLTPTKISHYLPKRIITKETISGKRINIENENKPVELKKMSTTTTAGWLSTEKMKKSGSTNIGLEFIQPVKIEKNDSLDNSCESIASSQSLAEPKQSIRKGTRNILNLKAKPQMKQAKLEFDRKKHNMTSNHIRNNYKSDETVCEIVCASPGVETLGSLKDKLSLTQRSLRKFSRKNSDDELFNISIKKSTATTSKNGTTNEETIKTSTPSSKHAERTVIKEEPVTCKKPYVINLFPHLNANKKDINEPLITEDSIDNLSLESITKEFESGKKDNINKNGNLTSSSVLILPPKSDDVIIVNETENVDLGDIDSADLFDEIMKRGNQTPSVLKKLENEQILKKKNNHEKSSVKPNNEVMENIKLESLSQTNDDDITQLNILNEQDQTYLENDKKEVVEKINTKMPITLQGIGHNCDCRHCNSYLRYLIELNLTVSEIKERLKSNTKHAERPLKLHLTPEGFWDPVMRDFPPGDPRNEVIIDYRFVDSNKEDKTKFNP
ncbi:uncharacterized protein LOC129606572 [Condylostylus longicornis]|uniref:uncharacterized protein LOC129606572 n=1 Tax=Condylostylus longicornis TaxID=2530218 RepID=UPI00244DDDD7|nr:uncharacterized protein LOC129606572 [Condylostylus longicornis]